MDDRQRDEIRRVLDRHIEVFITKDEKKNRERQQNRDKTIKWLMKRLENPIIPGGSTDRTQPEYTFTFGDLWYAVRDQVRIRDNNRCIVCGQEQKEVHHIRPRFLKGADVPENLVCLCLDCHDEVHRRIDEGIRKVLVDSLDLSDYLNKRNRSVSLDDFNNAEK